MYRNRSKIKSGQRVYRLASLSSLRSTRIGSLYLSVLVTCTVVSVLALAGMRAARVHLKSTTTGVYASQARLLAKSAIELGIAQLRANSDWRTFYAVDTPYPSPAVASAGGTFFWRLKTNGGSNRSLQGIGTVGDAVCTLEVKLWQQPDLDCTLLAGGDITVNTGCSLTCEDGPICANGDYNNLGSTTADVEAQSITGNTVVGTETVPGNQRILPSPDPIFEYYESQGTPLTPANMMGTLIVAQTVLSPNSSWGATNPNGIYVIDAGNSNVSISDSRIVGTIVVTNLDPGKKVIVAQHVNWEPAHPNYPSLLVEGDLAIELRDGELTEYVIFPPSFNPLGTPYQGDEDSDWNDSFASSLAGVVYCTGNLEIDGSTSADRSPDLRGVFIADGNCIIRDRMFPTIKHDPIPAMDPPPGFGAFETMESESAVSMLRSYSGSGLTDELLDDKQWAQYFKPNLPAEATGWRITRAEFYCVKESNNRNFEVTLYTPDGGNMPSSTVIDSVSANSNDLSSSLSWQGFDFSGTATIPVGDGVCLALTTAVSQAPLKLEYLSGGVSQPDSALITGDPSWNSFETDQALLCRVYGVYYTESGASKPVVIEPGSWRQIDSD